MDEEETVPVEDTTILEALGEHPPLPPAPPAPPATTDRRSRAWLLAAVVGALVGALVAGGIVAIAGGDGSSRPLAPRRHSSVFTQPPHSQAVIARGQPPVVATHTPGP